MTNANTEDTVALRGRIENWLTRTRGVEISVGRDEKPVVLNARRLRDAILNDSLEPESLTVDEDLKEALSALVSLLPESDGAPSEKLNQANAIYQFISRLRWTDDPLDEKGEFLLECAEIGWAAIGSSVVEITHRRRTADPVEIQQSKTDPVRTWNLDLEGITLIARGHLEAALEVREEASDEITGQVDALMSLLSALKNFKDVSPLRALKEAEMLCRMVEEAGRCCGVFDERDYLLGEFALVAAIAYRYVGRMADSARWLDRAEPAFRHTINPAPQLANVSLNRLALAYESGKYDEVLVLLPSLVGSYTKLGMKTERARCRLIEALSLKQTGRRTEAFGILKQLEEDEDVRRNSKLFGQVLVHIADVHVVEGQLELAIQTHQKALSVLRDANYPLGLAELKWSIGEIYRQQGNLGLAVESFREAQGDYRVFGMQSKAGQLHLTIAETLLLMDRPREAEWEILGALPTIEEQKMVPEGFAAVALLKESVRRRKTDPNALRELREHLQASK